MDLGIGLPNAVPGTTGKQLTDWARAAEEAGSTPSAPSTGSSTRATSPWSPSPRPQR